MNETEDEIDFVTLHNILYYIYIGCVNLPRELKPCGLPKGYPAKPNAFLLYRNAEKFLLPDLKAKCFEQLKSELSPSNVTERLFDANCDYYDELRSCYFQYLLDNYNEVKKTEGWKKVFLDEDGSQTVERYRRQLLFEISQKVNR